MGYDFALSNAAEKNYDGTTDTEEALRLYDRNILPCI